MVTWRADRFIEWDGTASVPDSEFVREIVRLTSEAIFKIMGSA